MPNAHSDKIFGKSLLPSVFWQTLKTISASAFVDFWHLHIVVLQFEQDWAVNLTGNILPTRNLTSAIYTCRRNIWLIDYFLLTTERLGRSSILANLKEARSVGPGDSGSLSTSAERSVGLFNNKQTNKQSKTAVKGCFVNSQQFCYFVWPISRLRSQYLILDCRNNE